MANARVVCWIPLWSERSPGVGLEHLVLGDGWARSVVLAVDDAGAPFRLDYRLSWEPDWALRQASLELADANRMRSMILRRDRQCRWSDEAGRVLDALEGCADIDIWPTPFTNSFPIRRAPMPIGERREFRMAWVFAPELSVKPQAQAYTRLDERRYLFENLDGSGFKAELPVDAGGIVLDYPGLFRRIP